MGGWDRQVNMDGDTLADALYERMVGIEDQLEEIAKALAGRADRDDASCSSCGHEVGAHFCAYVYNSDARDTCGCSDLRR